MRMSKIPSGVGGALALSNLNALPAGALTLAGNLAAGDAGADVVIKSTATRTAGKLLSIKNDGAEKAYLDWSGGLVVINGISAGTTGANAVQCGVVTMLPGAEPAATAGRVKVFAMDAGGGKFKLMARFPTGISQQIAAEP
jgi:hypothetical protein